MRSCVLRGDRTHLEQFNRLPLSPDQLGVRTSSLIQENDLDDFDEVSSDHRLIEHSVGTRVTCLLLILRRRSRDDNDGSLLQLLVCSNRLHQRDAVHDRHREVRDDEMWLELLCYAQTLKTILRLKQLVVQPHQVEL